MFKKFEQLDNEKQQRIINAALKEFAEKGFDKASTNTVVKEADISKGILFHYFGNKESLFVYLFDYCSARILKDLYENLDLEKQDILTGIHEIMLRKVSLMKEYPAIFEFVKSAYNESNLEIKEKIMKKQHQMLEESKASLFQEMDYGCFKKGLDMEKTMMVIYSTLEKISMAEITKKDMDVDKTVAQLDAYVDYFRELFYKNEKSH